MLFFSLCLTFTKNQEKKKVHLFLSTFQQLTKRRNLFGILSLSLISAVFEPINFRLVIPQIVDNMSSWSSERGCRPFPFSEIEKATDSFRNYLGRGGEGMVFKGVLKDGSHVAVKRLNPDLKQDDYEKEINMLSTLHHTNLVSLRAYCQKSDQEKILVYEFMSNGSLADNLYRKPAGFILSWEQRLNIAIGSARGLEYLHTGTSYAYKIIHRDVKPDNILLGSHWEAKVSDFGLSKRGPANQEHSSVITERARGTIGYYAPEYFSSGKITWRVDTTKRRKLVSKFRCYITFSSLLIRRLSSLKNSQHFSWCLLRF